MIHIYEIDNDGRGANTWEIGTEDGEYIGSYESLNIATQEALTHARESDTTVTIYTIEWYNKEHL